MDWKTWIERWDLMQERYLVKREERFRIIVRLLRDTLDSVSRVLDLGCGTGSLMVSVLKAFPQAKVWGVDFDPAMLWLADARLAGFGDRSGLILADLRNSFWTKEVPKSVDAVVSATALHWLTKNELSLLYNQIGGILKPGGIFLNADHVGSDCPGIQRSWESHRAEMRSEEAKQESDDWNSFWSGYSKALAMDLSKIHQRVIGGWEGGAEEGFPLAWHFDNLRASGFVSVDCFWRCDCDAIYGGIRGDGNA